MKIEGESHIYWKLPPTTLATFLFYRSIDVNQCYNDESSYSLLSPTTRQKDSTHSAWVMFLQRDLTGLEGGAPWFSPGMNMSGGSFMFW